MFSVHDKTHIDYGLQELKEGPVKAYHLCLKLFIYDCNIDIALTSVMPLSAICKAGETGFLYTHHDGLCYRWKEIMFI